MARLRRRSSRRWRRRASPSSCTAAALPTAPISRSCAVWCASPTPHAPLPHPSRPPAQYERTLRDGFGARDRLAYGSCGWGDAEVEELAATLREVAHPEVAELDLSDSSDKLTSLAALGVAVGGGALASLRTLNLSDCSRLTSLPAELGSLASLQTLDLDSCKALTSLPAEFAPLSLIHI